MAGICFVCTRCASLTTGASVDKRPRYQPPWITSTDGTVEAVIYGDLLTLVEGPPKRDRLTEFLYGPPTPPPRTLRTPQGLTARGSTLLVCDQGLPDVVGLDVPFGRIVTQTRLPDRPACPVSVTTDREGSTYVADTTLHAVLVYDSEGRLVQKFAPPDSKVTFAPTGALVSDQTLYVAGRGSAQVARYDIAAQKWLPPWSPTNDEVPLGVPTALAMSPEGILLVADALNGMLHRVDRDGRWLRPIGRRGRAMGELIRPMGVCCTRSGLILVADAAKQAIVVFEHDGRVLMEIGSHPENSWRWTLPCGVAALPEFDAGDLKGLDAASLHPGQDWVVVSDMLGGNGLTLIGIRRLGAPSDDSPSRIRND